jgi:chorismate synthase
MTTFGRIFQVSLFGESHGPHVGIVIDGCPAGMPLDETDFATDLERRKSGKQGTTKRVETDAPTLASGIFNGRTTGAPLTIWFNNEQADSSWYDANKDMARPGHSDFAAFKKFGGHNDYRGGGQFSGRLTVGLVAAGVIAKKIVSPALIEANLLEVGGSVDIQQAVRQAEAQGDSIGGLVECIASGLPVGLGEPFFDSVESLIAHAVFAIPAVKGIEFGAGFASVRMTGSQCNDSIRSASGASATNHAGGISGGITNGNDLLFRVAIKPTSSIAIPQTTINMKTGEQAILDIQGRHDSCIALRIAPVVEAVCAIVLADLLLIAHLRPRIWK